MHIYLTINAYKWLYCCGYWVPYCQTQLGFTEPGLGQQVSQCHSQLAVPWPNLTKGEGKVLVPFPTLTMDQLFSRYNCCSDENQASLNSSNDFFPFNVFVFPLKMLSALLTLALINHLITSSTTSQGTTQRPTSRALAPAMALQKVCGRWKLMFYLET